MSESSTTEQRDYPEVPPARVSSDPDSPDFHPSSYRIGVLVNGQLNRKVTFYDAQHGLFRLLGDLRRGAPRQAERVDVFWLRPESRQERRARERWDAKHRGRITPAPDRKPFTSDTPPMEGATKEPAEGVPFDGLQEVDQLGVRPVITVDADGTAHGIAEASPRKRKTAMLAGLAAATALGLGVGGCAPPKPEITHICQRWDGGDTRTASRLHPGGAFEYVDHNGITREIDAQNSDEWNCQPVREP